MAASFKIQYGGLALKVVGHFLFEFRFDLSNGQFAWRPNYTVPARNSPNTYKTQTISNTSRRK